jgi:hypothetical protein
MTEVTGEEFAVLRGVWDHPSQAYQPPVELLGAANQLLRRGLVQKAAAFPDVLVITPGGEDAYLAEIERRDARPS